MFHNAVSQYVPFYLNVHFISLQRNAIHKRGLCCLPMSIHLSVCLSRRWVVSRRLKISSDVIHLPRHLQEYHEWTADDARNAVKSFGLRKTYLHNKHSLKRPKYKNYHRARHCPFEGCTAAVKRLSSHLQCHKIASDSQLTRN